MDDRRSPVRVLVTVTYVVMVGVNYLANSLPLNGRRTGDVSAAYPSLFTPAGITFSVWGVIYLMLGAHVLYQWGLFRSGAETPADEMLMNRIGVIFAVSSMANTGWVFAWHYDLIPLSVVLIVVILVCLALITTTVRGANPVGRQRWFVAVPFSVYFGWTTVAVIANVTVLLVSWRWDGFGLPASGWAAIMVLIAMTIGTLTLLRNRDVAYGLVLIWALAGILLRQTASEGLDGSYPEIIAAVVIALAVLAVATALTARASRTRNSTI